MAEMTPTEIANLYSGLDRAAAEVLGERKRQIREEGYTLKHDDRHPAADLAKAAAAYVVAACFGHAFALPFWPWEAASFKPKDVRRSLVIAAALLLAAIERMDREQLIAPDVEGA